MQFDNQKVLRQIQSATGISDCFDFCKSMCELLEENPESYAELLDWFFQVADAEYGYKKADFPLMGDFADKLEDYSQKYDSLIGSIVNFISVKGYDKQRYYQELWNSIKILLHNASMEEKGYCLHQILWNARNPYYELPDSILISDQRFQEIVNDIEFSLKQLTFAFEIYKSQHYSTELTSRVVKLFEQMDTFEQKAVFLACFMNRLRKYWDEKKDKTEKEKSEKPNVYETKSPVAPKLSDIQPVDPSSCELINNYPFPDMNGDKYDFILARDGDRVFLSDQGNTFVKLDAIFELKEPDVIKNLVAILRQYGAKKQGTEFILELNDWDGNTNETESEVLKKGLMSLYSCVSFMLNMKIFYV